MFSPVRVSPFSARSWMASSNSANDVCRNSVWRMPSRWLPSSARRVASSFARANMWWRSRFSFSVEATSATKMG